MEKRSGYRVVCTGVRKSFAAGRGSIAVLNGIDLAIEPGEFFVLLGPSGCGKSTLLNLAAGLACPDAGSILIGDMVVADAARGITLSPFERDVSMVFQSYALYPHMTVARNLAFPLTNLRPRLSRSDIEHRVKEVAALLHITKLLDRKPAQLSGGERQRVAIGRAIVRKPRLFLMDEPLSNLDAQLRTTMRTRLKALQRELGITVIYVTHDQMEAMTLGDRLAVMHGGVIEQVGPPARVYDAPRTPFVARFVGSPPMNLIDGVVRRTDEGWLVETGLFCTPVAEEHAHPFGDAAPVVAGFRPEGVEIVAQGGEWNATVGVSENAGCEWYHTIFTEESQLVFRTAVPLSSSCVSLRFKPGALRLFSRHPTRSFPRGSGPEK